MYWLSWPGDLTLGHIDLKFSENVLKGCPIGYAKFKEPLFVRYSRGKKLRGLHKPLRVNQRSGIHRERSKAAGEKKCNNVQYRVRSDELEDGLTAVRMVS